MDLMNNLIIGNTAQLNYYFPKEYDRISSRNINYSLIKENKYHTIFLLFAEQRTFLNENEKFFLNVNFNYTLDVINKIKNYCNKIVIYSTSELCNNYEGKVSLEMPFKYNYSPYIKSKELLSLYLLENKDEYKSVHIIYPFNFNSPYRKNGFLFSKIFDSIINKNKNTIGDISFLRDIIHPSILVNESIKTNKDLLIGSGELISIKKFVEDLFLLNNLNINDYICSNKNNNLKNTRKNYFSEISYSNYQELLNLTYYDTQKNTLG
jgi:nucleoside-diphosphate-sugar epimerase